VALTAKVVGVALLAMFSTGVPALVLVTVAVLAQGAVVQVTPAGGVAVTVLTMAAVELTLAVPTTEMAMAVPFGRFTLGSAMLLVAPVAPVPAAALSQSAPVPDAEQLQLTTLTLLGMLSVTLTPVRSDRPLLLTVMV
jgi:hypothetical protein